MGNDLTNVKKCSLYSMQRNFSVKKKRLERFNLSWNSPGEPSSRPPSQTTPLQPTIYFLLAISYLKKSKLIYRNHESLQALAVPYPNSKTNFVS